MASFKGFDDDDDVGDEGPHSNGPVPELDENAEAKAIGVYKERRSAKVRQTGGKIELRSKCYCTQYFMLNAIRR